MEPRRYDSIRSAIWRVRASIDRIVALDDFDVELAASLREHLAHSWYGRNTGPLLPRQACDATWAQRTAGSRFRSLCPVFNYDRVRDFHGACSRALGFKAAITGGCYRYQESSFVLRSCGVSWTRLGDMQSHYLLERFVPGDVFHVDTLVYRGCSLCLRLPAATDGLRWRCRTEAAFSLRAFSSAAVMTLRALLDRESASAH